ncbi:MAG TPA: hypothetical protein PLU80_19330, partial [Acidobacteriota bacterium]|nr:hypothetical protein [Acidobacteriota bacterium]
MKNWPAWPDHPFKIELYTEKGKGGDLVNHLPFLCLYHFAMKAAYYPEAKSLEELYFPQPLALY